MALCCISSGGLKGWHQPVSQDSGTERQRWQLYLLLGQPISFLEVKGAVWFENNRVDDLLSSKHDPGEKGEKTVLLIHLVDLWNKPSFLFDLWNWLSSLALSCGVQIPGLVLSPLGQCLRLGKLAHPLLGLCGHQHTVFPCMGSSPVGGREDFVWNMDTTLWINDLHTENVVPLAIIFHFSWFSYEERYWLIFLKNILIIY